MFATIQSRIFCIPVNYQKVKIKIYKTISTPVILYERENWSFTLTNEQASGQPDVYSERSQFESRNNNNWLKKWGVWRLMRTRQSTDFNFIYSTSSSMLRRKESAKKGGTRDQLVYTKTPNNKPTYCAVTNQCVIYLRRV
jgi:hypothetical protein